MGTRRASEVGPEGLKRLADAPGPLSVRLAGNSAQLSTMQMGQDIGVTIWNGIARHGLILSRPS